MTASLLKLFVYLLFMISGLECANILGICHYPSASHHMLGSTLLKELARRGHQVTMMSPFSLKQPFPNYTDIVLPYILDIKEEMLQPTLQSRGSAIQKTTSILEAALRITETAINNPLMQKLLSSDTQFDLVIIVWAASEPLLGVANHFGAPVVVLSTTGSGPMNNYLTDNPSPYAYIPYLLLPFTDNMSFLERAVNALASFSGDALTHYVAYYQQESVLYKYFPDNPGLTALVANISLVLLNSHYSFETPRPFVPNMIPVGGMHIQEVTELPQDIQEFLDSTTKGAIVFSLGSNLRSVDMQPVKIESFLRVFENLPQKVLWKWENDHLPNKPKNVKIVKWLPQNDVLAHPNVKLFITHGGLLSIMEAIHHGVPLIGLPFFGDQKSNLVACVSNGYGIMLHFDKLTDVVLNQAIMQILKNPNYRDSVSKKSLLLKDQPIKPLDNAVFWVEHTLRHGGAPHLRTAAVHLSWYQIILLDVFAFLLGLILTAIGLLYLFVKILIRCCCKRTKKVKATKRD